MKPNQCSSCGGFCKKSGCDRENVKPTPQRKPLTDEQDRAICEGSFNHESDAFFKENPLLDTDENRRIFYRGQRIIEDLEKKHKSYRSIEAAHGIKEKK